MKHAARIAFEVPYADPNGNIEAFIKCMERCRKEWTQEMPKLYAPYMAVVQGSMMGKSRLFHTLPGHDIFVFYICLGASGFPESIPALRDRLISESCSEGFYAAFILTALNALEKFRSENPEKSSQAWFDHQKSAGFWKPILGAT